MKTRRTLVIVIALLLISSMLPLPARAQASSITNFGLTGIDSTGEIWTFSWDYVPETVGIEFQFKGGGITDVWISLDRVTSLKLDDGGKTKLSVYVALPDIGQVFYFRVRVEDNDGFTGWSQLKLEFY
ncbi:MAG: hypothetical protein F4X87_02405 [Chloroflexi bacterium]|nr:hypothetical protein [Chloroflexota bacterium]